MIHVIYNPFYSKSSNGYVINRYISASFINCSYDSVYQHIIEFVTYLMNLISTPIDSSVVHPVISN